MNRRRFFQMLAGVAVALSVPIPPVFRPQFMTLSDWAKRLPQDGRYLKVAELLNERNHLLDDMLWIEGNEGMGHEQA